MDTNGSEADVSIGTEIPDIDNEAEDQESVHSYRCTHDIPSMSSANLDEADDQGNESLIPLRLNCTCSILGF